jgi:hypothetical protein
MADCVVPQEYGTTIAEKRSVGVKICSSLLYKIKDDLHIARTDNKADMRYMINMDYSADLPINTMGRRIRTRLYFTSESHLHTMLNVLRFAGHDGAWPLLSQDGIAVLNNAGELCYLTQIVIRLFEDTNRAMEDPRRFRVEILFSPGATATPLHMDETNRNADSSRLDTAPLLVVGRDGLTCQEVEDFFESAILEGKHDNSFDVASASVAVTTENVPSTIIGTVGKKVTGSEKSQVAEEKKGNKAKAAKPSTDKVPTSDKEGAESRPMAENNGTTTDKPVLASSSANSVKDVVEPAESAAAAKSLEVKSTTTADQPPPVQKASCSSSDGKPLSAAKSISSDNVNGGGGDNKDKKNDEMLARRYFWGTIALGTLLLGSGCLVMALSLTETSRTRRRRTNR